MEKGAIPRGTQSGRKASGAHFVSGGGHERGAPVPMVREEQCWGALLFLSFFLSFPTDWGRLRAPVSWAPWPGQCCLLREQVTGERQDGSRM